MLSAASLWAQGGPVPAAAFPERLTYLLGQTSSGFQGLRGDSLGPGTWRHRQFISADLDSATAAAGSTITELTRRHADGRPGKAVVAVFPLASVTSATQGAVYARYRDLIAATIPTWQNRSTDGGDWTECADPSRRSSSRTA